MKNIGLCALAVALCLGTQGRSIAQEETERIHLTRVQLKPDMVDSYKKLLKDEVMPAYQKSDVEWVDAWEAYPFGDGPELLFAAGIASYARYDEEHSLVAVLGEEKASALMNRVRSHATGYQTSALQLNEEQSYWGGDSYNVAIAWEGDSVPGKHGQAVEYLGAKIMPAMKKAGVVNFLVHSRVFGPGAELFVVVMRQSFGQIDKGHPVRQVHEAAVADKIMAEGDALFENTKVTLYRYLPELSYDNRKAAGN